jgi:membrane peptidoglycan carboxypeptidase
MKYNISSSSSRKSIGKRRRKVGKRVSPTTLSSYSRIKKYNGRNISNKKRVVGVKGSKFLKGKFDKAKLKKSLYILIGVGFFVGCVVLIGVGIYLKSLQGSLPSPDQLVDRSSDQSTQIFDKNNTLLYTVYGDQNREFVSIDKIPEHTKWALLAAEDIEFYQHKGIDYFGIAMAAIQNARSGEVVRGASTITQQLVKTTLLYDILGDEVYKSTYSRKIKEVLITMQVEQTLTKDEILQMYMNEVPLGGVNYGFQAAANAYFGKDVSELDLAESAMIAGIISSPGVYSPLYGTKPELAEVRQDFVLDQMLKHKSLTGVTQEEIDQAKEEVLVYNSKKIDIKAPHFVFYVKQLLEEEYGADRVQRGGLKVVTTLDYSIQQIAEEELRKVIGDEGKRYNVFNGSVVVQDPNTGQILAMVGSVDYWNTTDKRVDGNVNVATSERQVGSSAKPYAYLTAFTQGYSPGVLAPDIEMSFGKYKPTNWDFKYEGIGTIRKNLGRSRNVPAVYTLQYAGIEGFLQTTDKLGITTLKNKGDYGLALALGAGEMKLVEHTAAFGVFANEGERNPIESILKVETSQGEVLEDNSVPTPKRVFDEKEIYLLNYILCDLGGHGDRLGLGYSRISGKNVCFKTGTTNGPKDVTAVMYHKNLAVGVWAGNNDNSLLPGAWGSSVALPIAYSITSRLSDRYPVELFNRPAGILSTAVCTDTGAIATEDNTCTKEATVYISGHAPQMDNRKIVSVCKENGLIAENLEAAKKYDLVEDKIVLSTTLENRNQIDAYFTALGAGYLKVEPPTGYCPLPLGPDNAPLIDLSSPLSGAKVKNNENINIRGSIRVMESVSQFNALIDGTAITTPAVGANGAFDFSQSASGLSIGNHTLTLNVTDNKGKVGSVSVPFSVIDGGSGITVSLLTPPNGVSVVFPVLISASVQGISPTQVRFSIIKKNTANSVVLTDNNGADGWSAMWTSASHGKGTYQITAQAFVNSQVYSSGTNEVIVP